MQTRQKSEGPIGISIWCYARANSTPTPSQTVQRRSWGARDSSVCGGPHRSRSTEPLAVINLNFVYGVRTADRKLWLETAIEGCERAGIPYVISVHPAEKARVDSDRVTSISASRLLPRASVLISRFSTMPFEAMARGVPFIYHNPHGETVKTFNMGIDAYPITSDSAGLRSALTLQPPSGQPTRDRVSKWLEAMISINETAASEARGSAEIREHLAI